MGSWFGGATPTPAPTPAVQANAAGESAPRVYYAGTTLKVYSEPGSSSSVVGELSQYEKVTRFKLERGYAYVESATGSTKGWVVNAQLIWRLPSSNATAPAETEPETPAVPATEQAPSSEVPATATPIAATATPTNTVAPAAPSSKATPRGVAPSIFDAY